MPSLYIITWIIGIFASVGIVGVILLLILAPTAAAALVKVVRDILATRLGLAIAVGLLCGYACLVYGDRSGRSEVRAAWAEANAQAALEAKARDESIAKDTAAKYEPLIAERDKTISDFQTQAEAYEKQLVASKVRACPLGAPALRLRHQSGGHAPSRH